MNLLNNPKRALIIIMGALFLIGFGIANFYYSLANSSVDPRVIEARELYSKYDSYTENSNFKGIFNLLDSIENIYNSIEHYSNSFEVGVLYNNRAAAYLSMAIYFKNNSLSLNGKTTLTKDTLLVLAENAALQSIKIYENWLGNFSNLPDSIIKVKVKYNFLNGLNGYSPKENDRFISKRVSEIKDAQLETPRRLSVAYTNLGTINRHMENYDKTIKYYEKAIELWDRNLTAQNNLNKLLDRPLKKQNMLQKLFPPDKEK